MSDFMNDGQTTSTRLMCIALVGVRPADKILMKEYMRLLFGLKVGIDWVLVSHPNVDLFLVGSEFRQSSVVIKLLSDQKHKPVLYVSHSDDYEGQLIDDHLFLPVSSLEVLKEWLLASVTMLGGSDKTFNDFSTFEDSSVLNHNISSGDIVNNAYHAIKKSQAEQAELAQAQTQAATELSASRANPENDAIQAKADATVAKGAETGSFELNFSSDSQHSNHVVISDTVIRKPPARSTARSLPISSSTQTAEGYDCILKLIEYVQQRVSGLYQITVNKQLIAIIEPSRGRVWSAQRDVNTSSLSLDLNWQLQSYAGQPLAEDKADDLIQYLWQYGWMSTHWLMPLVNDESSYQLEYWIKPVLTIFDNMDDHQPLARIARQKLLAIMNALEFAPYNIRQLSELTSTPIKATNKIVASLLFAGSVTAMAQPYQSKSTAIFDIAIKPEHSFAKQGSDDDLSSEDDDVKQDIEHNDTNDTSDVLIDQQIPTDEFFVDSQPTKPAPEQKEKRGFLSRLRNKLGL